MIDNKKIEDKLKPLNDKIKEINVVYGDDLTHQLLDRIEISLEQFFTDFKRKSSLSFSSYWKQIVKVDSKMVDKKIIRKSHEKKENMPKFIAEFEKKNKK